MIWNAELIIGCLYPSQAGHSLNLKKMQEVCPAVSKSHVPIVAPAYPFITLKRCSKEVLGRVSKVLVVTRAIPGIVC